MKNFLFQRLRGRLKLRISGKNIERFIHRLMGQNIELLRIWYPKRDVVEIEVYSEDYERIEELKTIYDVTIIGSYGILSFRKRIRFYKELLLSLTIGFCFLLLLTNTIFKIEVVHTDSDVRAFLKKELEEHGIKEMTIRKSYHTLDQIRKDIMDENRDRIEWLEIENVGTSYIVRVELREIEKEKKQGEMRNIVAKKNAIITRVVAERGTIVRTKNDYVKKGDVIISGEITLNEEVKNVTSAEGKVYGEVWYETKVEYPLSYREVKYTGRTKNVYAFRFLNHTFELFTLHPFKEKEYKEKKILFDPAFPIGIVYQEQKEVERIDQIYGEKEALKKAVELGRKQIESKLDDNEYVIGSKNLKVEVKESKIIVDIFFSVCEDITDYAKIEPKIEEVPQKEE